MLVAYHDEEWGKPVSDDRRLFEMLTLEGAQAGLSWLTILRKREGYRNAFAGFDPHAIAQFTDRDRERLLADARIVRNRAKIDSTIGNAKAFLALLDEFGSFRAYLAQFVPNPGRTLPRAVKFEEIEPTSAESDAISRDLKKRGFRFAGSTIVFAFMEAVGLVDDHMPDCFLYRG